METFFVIAILILFGGTTLYVFISRVIIPIYKIYLEQQELK